MGLSKPDTEVEDVADEEVETETTAEETPPKKASKPSKEKSGKAEKPDKAAKPAPEPSSNVAVLPNTAVAEMSKGGKFEDQMADDGFEGLEVGFYSYTTIKLATEGRFETAEGVELGKSLKVQLMESKRKYAYTNSEDENLAAFSYDRVHNVVRQRHSSHW